MDKEVSPFMNTIEKALMHGLFIHLHHNIDKAIDFSVFRELNEAVAAVSPGKLLIGPDANDDAAVFQMPGDSGLTVAKMESHCSPCVPRPYDSAATGAGGAMRDVVAMGARPLFLLDFIGTRPLDQEVIVGPCGFKGECTCGECVTMTSGERVNLMVKGIRDMCETMGVYVVGGGLSTSFSDIVPAVVATVIGRMVADKPLTKPAKRAGDRIIIVGKTDNDGNDTLYRAGLADVMRPAVALFSEEKTTMESALAAIKTGKINACSDLGAAGIGAAVSESVRFGGLGARIDLALAPVKAEGLTPEEILICETQARMLFQVAPEDAAAVMEAARSGGAAVAEIGEITGGKEALFMYGDREIARIPHQPPAGFAE
jgi:phosphoribosylformylglycinamidine synthase subunit PurL